MKKPKFQVGDVVQIISYSTGRVICDRAQILSVRFQLKANVGCVHTGRVETLYNTYAYETSYTNSRPWNERSIHPYPKHQPSEFTFSALMDDLKTEVVA